MLIFPGSIFATANTIIFSHDLPWRIENTSFRDIHGACTCAEIYIPTLVTPLVHV
jgi:hypothetical protein